MPNVKSQGEFILEFINSKTTTIKTKIDMVAKMINIKRLIKNLINPYDAFFSI